MIRRDPDRSGYWNVVLEVPRHLQESTGKKQLKRRVKGTKKQAELVAAGLIKQLSEGTMPAARDYTLNDLIAKSLESKRSRIRERTLNDYNAVWERYLRKSLGQVTLSRLNTLAIDQHYTRLTEKGLGGASIRKVQAVLGQALRYGLKMQLVPKNWSQDVDLPRTKTGRQKPNRPIDLDQVPAYLRAAREEPLGALLEFLLVTGARPSEAFALLWSDLDLANAVALITKTLFLPKGGGWRFEPAKTEQSHRTIHLPPGLVMRLQEHSQQQEQLRLLLGPEWLGDEATRFVFTGLQGGIVRLKALHAAHKRTLKAAAIPETTLYALRATMATLLADAGTDVKTTSTRLGHSTTKLTLDIYTHQRDRANRGAAKALEGAIYYGERPDVLPYPRRAFLVAQDASPSIPGFGRRSSQAH